VTLGDYRSYRREIEPVTVTDEALQEALEYVRVRHQTIETVDRPAEAGDVVAISGTGRFTTPKPPAEGEEASEEGEVLFDEERLEILLDEKTLFPDTSFVDNVIGMAVGDRKELSITFPDPYENEPEYAGREAAFDITVLEVKRRDLPELDDELARQEGNYESLDELRDALRADLTHEAENAQQEKTMEDMIDRLLEDAELVYPPAAIESQLDDMVQDFSNRLSRSGWKMQDYLNLNGLTEESLRDDFRENAERLLRRQLALRQFILNEKLRIEAADIDALVEERVARFDNEGLRDSMRNYYRSGQGFDLISSEVLSNKAYQRIREIFSGLAPDLESLAAESAGLADEEE
jgi:trigger factor